MLTRGQLVAFSETFNLRGNSNDTSRMADNTNEGVCLLSDGDIRFFVYKLVAGMPGSQFKQKLGFSRIKKENKS